MMFLRSHLVRVGYHYGTTGPEDLKVLHKNANDNDIVDWHHAFAQRCGVDFAFSFASGRMALYAILAALDIQHGDEIILPAYTCVVVPNAILFAGGRPVYADIEPDTFNLDPKDVHKKITPQTRAVLVQHTFGLPANIDAIRGALAGHRGIALIEDCCHALGAEYNGKPVGYHGDAAFFSLDATKMVCSDIGGVATTGNPKLGRRLAAIWEKTPEMVSNLANKIRRQFYWKHYSTRPWSYWNVGRIGLALTAQTSFGFHQTDELDLRRPSIYPYPCRFPRTMVAVAMRQLSDLDCNLSHRRYIASRLSAIFHDYAQPHTLSDAQPSWLRFPLRVKNPLFWRQAFGKYIEIGDWFNSPAYGLRENLERIGYVPGSCSVAEETQRCSINFPTHAMINEEMLNLIPGILTRCRRYLE